MRKGHSSKCLLLSLTCAAVTTVVSKAQTDAPIVLHSGEQFRISGQVSLLEDKDHLLSIQDVVASDKFTKSPLEVPNLGVTFSTHWVKIPLLNKSRSEDLFLRVAQTDIDEGVLYAPTPDGQFKAVQFGENYPFDSRQVEHHHYIFPITVPRNETKTFYLKIKTGDQLLLPIFVGSPPSTFLSLRGEDILFGIYCGVILVMFLYNVFILYSTRDKTYLYYVVYVLLVGLTQAAILGHLNQYLWPFSPWFSKMSVPVLSCLSAIMAVEFFKRFLNLKEYSTLLYRLSFLITGAYALTLVLSLAGFHHIGYTLILLLAAICSLFMLIIGIVVFRKGYRAAKFFLAAWSTFLVGLFLYVLKDFGLLPNNPFTTYTMPFGSALETVLMSLALADRINILREEKELVTREKEANERELIERREKQALLEGQEEKLETEVANRTKELEKAMVDLQETQLQLVESGKMASLGQMAAGVAHEVNNPMHIINQCLIGIRMAVEDLERILVKYIQIEAGAENSADKLKAAHALRDELKYEELFEEMNGLLKQGKTCVGRVEKITKQLREYSQVDANIKEVNDIHNDIASFLELNSSSLLKGIHVTTEFGKMPTFSYHPKTVYQAIENVVRNAVQAIGEREEPAPKGQITIKTKMVERTDIATRQFVLSVTDNGVGMDEEVLHRAIDPFFTTRSVGSGEGIGLSAAKGTMKSHGGDLKINSKKGKGTTIWLLLPIDEEVC